MGKENVTTVTVTEVKTLGQRLKDEIEVGVDLITHQKFLMSLLDRLKADEKTHPLSISWVETKLEDIAVFLRGAQKVDDFVLSEEPVIALINPEAALVAQLVLPVIDEAATIGEEVIAKEAGIFSASTTLHVDETVEQQTSFTIPGEFTLARGFRPAVDPDPSVG